VRILLRGPLLLGCSSAAERRAVNTMVVGSIPTFPAILVLSNMQCVCGCQVEIGRHGSKYASQECQNQVQSEIKVKNWLAGNWESGIAFVKGAPLGTKSFVKRWLVKTRGEKCEKCGWQERNVFTGKIPLNVHHIDGDVLHCYPLNLDLLCPNCHSLTSNFGSRNLIRTRNKLLLGM
jgi:hypothetical protein